MRKKVGPPNINAVCSDTLTQDLLPSVRQETVVRHSECVCFEDCNKHSKPTPHTCDTEAANPHPHFQPGIMQ
eukprot:6470814-Amphidinium_carterae.1